ncbi:protein indeterminate-domain 12-like [Cornus florida]|uniref:protein indeterminate-domain 12-like n=1 Tax=Cornus florida TaxID=4283 RepID=UPI00289AC505|nr:protein indeterminate-domain 12-like [Cornus florida]
MFPSVMSNSTSLSHEEVSVSSGAKVQDFGSLNPMVSSISTQQPQKIKKKRNLPGNPDPDAEVIALSPKTLLATNRFVCEICNKGFQRDQNLQLHRRGHNLPWKLKQRNNKENRKRAYVCPEPTCVHHHPSRALGDLTGIKKHFCRKHGEKKWRCEKCSKIYAVQSDWKAHSKTCGTREYRCDCGTLFSRKDSFITHRAFCDALAEESARLSVNLLAATTNQTANQAFNLHDPQNPSPLFPFTTQPAHISLNPWDPPQNPNPSQNPLHIKPETTIPPPPPISSSFFQEPPPHKTMIQSFISNSATSAHLSATALLQKAATVGAQSVGQVASTMGQLGTTVGHVRSGISPEYLCFNPGNLAAWQQKSDRLTRDFLGLTADCGGGGGGFGGGNADDGVNASVNLRGPLSFTGCVDFSAYDRDHTLLKPQGFGFADTWG